MNTNIPRNEECFKCIYSKPSLISTCLNCRGYDESKTELEDLFTPKKKR